MREYRRIHCEIMRAYPENDEMLYGQDMRLKKHLEHWFDSTRLENALKQDNHHWNDLTICR